MAAEEVLSWLHKGGFGWGCYRSHNFSSSSKSIIEVQAQGTGSWGSNCHRTLDHEIRMFLIEVQSHLVQILALPKLLLGAMKLYFYRNFNS